MATNYYSALGVPQNATRDQIRSRFLELARKLHPDRYRGPLKEKAEEDFQSITEAFNVLTNDRRRRDHDEELAQPQSEQNANDPQQLARVYTQRGIKAYREKNFFAAADNFDRATQADPTSAKAWYHLALACYQQERWTDRAVAAVERACELDRMNPNYRKLAGRVLTRAGMTEQAERYYNEALRWGGDDPTVRQALEELQKSKKGRSRFFGRNG